METDNHEPRHCRIAREVSEDPGISGCRLARHCHDGSYPSLGASVGCGGNSSRMGAKIRMDQGESQGDQAIERRGERSNSDLSGKR